MELKQQIKSKERVREHGEVFTADREVKAMVDLVDYEVRKVVCDGGRVLEPACGDGNFLVEILRRKCETLRESCCSIKKCRKCDGAGTYYRLKIDSEEYAFYLAIAISKLYGIDIMPDNIYDCRDNLVKIVLEEYDLVVKNDDGSCRKLLEDAAKIITKWNIVVGDALSYKSLDGRPIVFVFWQSEKQVLGKNNVKLRIGVCPYYYEYLVEGSQRENYELLSVSFCLNKTLPRSGFYDFYKMQDVSTFLEGIKL